MNNYIPLSNYPNCLECHHKHSHNGKNKNKSKQSKQKEDTGNISSTNLTKKTTIQNNQLFMPESHHQNKKWTFNDKLQVSKPSIQIMKLSKTLDQVSISREEDSSPFWNESFQGIYQKLWLPIKTDFVDLESSCLDSSLKDLKCPLKYCQIWISKTLQQNSQQTSFQSLRFTQPDTMVQENIISCKKIRIYPNEKQIQLFNKCLGATRFFFNKANSILKERGVQGLLKLQNLRPLVMQSDKDLQENDPMLWQKEVPYDTRQNAIAQCITSYKSCITKLRKHQITHFDVSYKSKKKQTSQSFLVNKDALNCEEFTIFSQRLKKKKKIRVRNRDISTFLEGTNGDVTILKIRPNYWYICLPIKKEPPIFQNAIYKSAFLDSGVRTFQTLYSPDGICGKIGNSEFSDKLKQLSNKHDHLWSISDSKLISSKTKKNIRSRCAIIRKKIKDIITDFHWQTCSFLCKTFQNIFIPRFEVSQMVHGSPLGNKITRKMLQLSHGIFRERLLYYGKKYNRNVYLVGEEYSTKTCGCCGQLKDMAGLKTYKCSNCQIEIDRDYNGARNICLKLLSKFL